MSNLKIKNFILPLLLGSIIISGCSAQKNHEITQSNVDEEKIYTSSFTMTDILKENISAYLPHITEASCYYQTVEWDADAQNSLRNFYKFDMETRHSQPWVIDSEESGSTITALADDNKTAYYIKKSNENGAESLYLEKWGEAGIVYRRSMENAFEDSLDELNLLSGLIVNEELLYLLEADGNIYTFHTDGSLQQSYKLPEAQQYALVKDGAGQVYGICKEGRKVKIYKLEKTIEDAVYEFSEEKKEFPLAVESSLGEGLIWWDEEGIYSLDLAEKISEQIVQWNDEYVNIEWNSVQKVTQIPDQQYLILLYYPNEDYVDIARLYEVDEKLVPQKKVITFGMPDNEWGYYDSYISSFNRISKEYQVVIKTYSGEKESGISALQKEILAGMAPDIIDLSLLPIADLCEKNILEDLAPYFDNSTVVRKEDIPGFVWEAWQTDGKLCSVFPDFSIIANATWDESQSWDDGYSMEQIVEWSQANPDINILQDMSIHSLMDYFLNRNRNHFIDWEQGECYFIEDEFIQFLSFIKSQAETGKTPAAYDRNEIEESFRNKEFLFYRAVLNDIGAFCNYDNSLGDNVEWTGFPEDEGKLSTRILATCIIGVNANSSYKEGAWSFLECMLSSQIQRRNCLGLLENGFSIREDVLEAQLNKTYISRNDSLYDNKKTATKQQMGQMKKLMEAGSYTSIYGSSREEKVLQMIQEEIGAFLNQDKTAEETAGLIQNRIQLFINE